jgi:hypothetical protein
MSTQPTEAHLTLALECIEQGRSHYCGFDEGSQENEQMKAVAQLIADSEARAVERATIDAQTAGNALFYAIYERMKPHFPDGSRDLDWDVLPSTIGATCKALTTEREKVRVLREALDEAQSCGGLTGSIFMQARAALAATKEGTP